MIVICEPYKTFIKTFPCLVCSFRPVVDPDHWIARGTGSHKRNDFFCLPLCRNHHGEKGNWGLKTFAETYGFDPWEKIAGYLVLFNIKHAKELKVTCGKS